MQCQEVIVSTRMEGTQHHYQTSQMQQRRKHRSSSRAPKYPSLHAFRPSSHKRLYDPRRWHRHKHSDKKKSSDGCQPPAGWVLVWAGRFKRWRRRWFVAHSPGLLLYYKNSDQLGRPGCINLQCAEVGLIAGKERQFKIRKGSRVFHFRTLNKENRQAWLETIKRSIDIYEKSREMAGIKSSPLFVQQTVPPYLTKEWKEQEKEVNHRLAEKMQELEPMKQAFLHELQTLQHSLSLVSDALGFTCQLDTSKVVPTTPSVDRGISPLNQHQINIGYSSEDRTSPMNNLHGRLPPAQTSKKAGDCSNQLSLVASILEPTYTEKSRNVLNEQKVKGQQHESVGPSRIEEHEFLTENANCIGMDIFRRRRGGLDKGHSSDTEILDSKKSNRPPLYAQKTTKKKLKFQPESPLNVSPYHREKEIFPVGRSRSPISSPGDLIEKQIVVTSIRNGGSQKLSKKEEINSFKEQQNFRTTSGSTCQGIPGRLHVSWNAMQDTFTEILKGEIQRVIELEAENAVLQQSLASLPQLQKDRIDLLDLKQSIQLRRDGVCESSHVHRDINGEYEYDNNDNDDMEDEISLVHSEDYFEALEVLNQHEFITKATSPEELEILAEPTEFSQGPPEEGGLSEPEGEDDEQPRNRLPAPRPLSRGFSLWSVLKNAIGKDLNRITMPATINEPLSVLQRSAEELHFRHLIDEASKFNDSIERLAWVSAYACAVYHGTPHRDAKPFNPLLGETYEWQGLDGKSRFIAEQVSHHPPILAYHFENMLYGYTIYGEAEIKNKFWGKSVEVVPAGIVHLHMERFGDHFTWSKITTCIHNVVVGKLWIDNYGEIVIRNHSTGDISRIRIHKASGKEQGQLSGKVFDKLGNPQCSIHGNYMKEIFLCPESSWISKKKYGQSKCIWKCPDKPQDYEQQYCFSSFAITLNELTPKLRDSLPPTDSRFRPDQRALEDGDLEKATPEKLRLEEKQREARRQLKEERREWECMWFEPRVAGVTQVKCTVDDGGDIEPSWVYNGKYWNVRGQRGWEMCPDIM